MELKRKLKELRAARGMTQESVAEYLGVSSQTVSKWERGLLNPDISLLPKIAALYRCTIDSLFDVELTWSVEHRREFEAKIHELHAKKDWEGVYKTWIQEIELNPDNYGNYLDVMLHVLRKEMFDKEHIEKMISLADHAEQCCINDNIRNEIYRIMLQICLQSDDPKTKSKGKYYYNKLPMLRHSREVYAKYMMKGEEYRKQLLKNLIYLVDLAECSIRQLILPDMPLEEKLFYYQKAAMLYETVLDSKFAGHYDPPLITDYYEIAIIHTQLGEMDKAAEYVDRILEVLERHMSEAEKENMSKLLYAAVFPNHASFEQLCQSVLRQMLANPKLEPFKDKMQDIYERYSDYFSLKGN